MLSIPSEAIKHQLLFRVSWWILALLLMGYLFAEQWRIPVSVVAGLAALVFLVVAACTSDNKPGEILRSAPWAIVFFSIGMYVVVYGLRNVGFTDGLSLWIRWMIDQGTLVATVGMGFTAALLSSVMNNLPTVMIGLLAINEVPATEVVKESLIYANIIGSDLGPKMTPIGSLATLLWLHVLSQKDVKIGWGMYMKVGIALTIPTLLITLIGLYCWLSVVNAL